MKLLIDLVHPANVHYFRNFILRMQESGNTVLITARKKDIAHQLLAAYNLPYHDMGRSWNGHAGKMFYILWAFLLILRHAVRFRPDVYISFGSSYVAFVAFLFRKPHIVFDDTEIASLNRKLYLPFSTIVLTPSCFNVDFGQKQKRFEGFMELCYLHPNQFQPDPGIVNKYGFPEKFIIIRFVSWEAFHDQGHQGLNYDSKKRFIQELSRFGRVYITSEAKLPEEFEPHQIKIRPEHIHDLMRFALMYVGESPTMTTEAALLGTPAICISSWACDCGNLKELRKYDIAYCYPPSRSGEALRHAVELLEREHLKEEWEKKRMRLLADKIDVTRFMIELVQPYQAASVR